MILITERRTTGGNPIYEMENLTTGAKKTWKPPQKLERSMYKETLRRVATQFEEFSANAVEADCNGLSESNDEPDQNMTLQQFATRIFMPRKTPFIAENTRDGWCRYLRLRIIPCLGSKALSEITPFMLSRFLFNMQTEGLARETVDRYYTLLKSIFDMAREMHILSANPMNDVKRPKPRIDEKVVTEVEAYTSGEVAQILSCLEKEPLKWRVVMHLLIETGMRIGECTALRWDAIDWRNKAITISTSQGYTSEAGSYIGATKSKRSRVVYVSDDLMILLFQKYQENARDANSPYVNTQDHSKLPMHPQSPGGWIRRFGARHGFPGIHPHKMRHSYASIAITHGADVASVAANLGHKDSSVTLRIYTSANENSKRQASNICYTAVRNALNANVG